MRSDNVNVANDKLKEAVSLVRAGDFEKLEDRINEIGNLVFPSSEIVDPMWLNAQRAVLRGSIYSLIDVYINEEHAIRKTAKNDVWLTDKLNDKLDELWNRVTLVNVFYMCASLAFADKNFSYEKKDLDSLYKHNYLSLFFDATVKLPTNKLRMLIKNEYNILHAMASSDATIFSIYSIQLGSFQIFLNAPASVSS